MTPTLFVDRLNFLQSKHKHTISHGAFMKNAHESHKEHHHMKSSHVKHAKSKAILVALLHGSPGITVWAVSMSATGASFLCTPHVAAKTAPE